MIIFFKVSNVLIKILTRSLRALRKIKDIFTDSINSYGKIDTSTIFGNPFYESIMGNFDSVNELFEGKLNEVIEEMAQAFCLRKAA